MDARFEEYIAGHQPTKGSRDFAMFSTNDELIGPAGVQNNMAVSEAAGYKILIDADGGHRLRRPTLKLAKNLAAN